MAHAAYLSVKDEEEFQYSYLREQMLKQYVLLYLAEGKYDMFKDENKDFTDLEPEEAVSRVMQKIEKVYYESLE